MDTHTKKRGRPKKKDGKRNQILVKLSDTELERVSNVEFTDNVSKAEALRKAFEYWYRNVF